MYRFFFTFGISTVILWTAFCAVAAIHLLG
jgi:hypothetical protein